MKMIARSIARRKIIMKQFCVLSQMKWMVCYSILREFFNFFSLEFLFLVLRVLKLTGSFTAIEKALDEDNEFRVRKPKSVSSFRGFLEISPLVNVAIWSYLKVVPNNYPAPKKIRKKNGEEVKEVRSFYSSKTDEENNEEEKTIEIPKEELVKVQLLKIVLFFSELQ